MEDKAYTQTDQELSKVGKGSGASWAAIIVSIAFLMCFGALAWGIGVWHPHWVGYPKFLLAFGGLCVAAGTTLDGIGKARDVQEEKQDTIEKISVPLSISGALFVAASGFLLV